MMNEKTMGIYVHIPFCVKKCAYCDFLSAPASKEEQKLYVQALMKEISLTGKERSKKAERISSVFFGGGTPSLLDGEQIAEILHVLREAFEIAPDAEITLEANPGTVDGEKPDIWKEAGVNRISIGLQSVHQKELALLGRIHTYEDFLNTFLKVRKAGFTNVSVDLMSGLPGQTEEDFVDTLEQVAGLSPEHISAYSLIFEEGTPFYEWFCTKETPFPEELGPCPPLMDEETDRAIYHRTKEVLREFGYERYEISNYAKPGFESRHNERYWTGGDYLGFGIGASSYVENVRYHNVSDLAVYERAVQKNGPLEEIRRTDEILTKENQMEEFMFLGLRMSRGISATEFAGRFGISYREVYGDVTEKLMREGLLSSSGDRIFLTDRGVDVSNTVFVEFLF